MADQNRNAGSKQGDGDASESFESHPSEKRGSAGKSDGRNKSKSDGGHSSDSSGYSAGSKDVDENGDIERPENNRTNRDTTMDR